MLRSLLIKNIALIEELEILPGEGLNCLTGETGAGKSVVVDSIGFVLGARSYRDLIRTGSDGCSVNAVFEEDGNCLGKVMNVLQTGSNDVYEVTDDEGRTIMIPALKNVVLDVNIEEAVIKVKLLPGLKEIYYAN